MNIYSQRFSEEDQKLHQFLKFISKLLLVGAVYSIAVYLYADTDFLQAAVAELIGSMLDATGYQSVVQGYSIIVSNTEYVITQKSIGVSSIAAFIALIYASTNRILEHLNVIWQGLVILITANLIRIYSIIVLTERNILKFNFIYEILIGWSLMVISLSLWVYWVKNTKNKQPVYQRRIKEAVKRLRENQTKTKR